MLIIKLKFYLKVLRMQQTAHHVPLDNIWIKEPVNNVVKIVKHVK